MIILSGITSEGINSSGINSVAQFLTVLFIFILVLLLTRYTLKWTGKLQKLGNTSRNFEVIETFKVAQDKFLQIIKVGEKYLLIAICKSEISMLTELDEDGLDLSSDSSNSDSFQKLFYMAKDKMQKKDNEQKAD